MPKSVDIVTAQDRANAAAAARQYVDALRTGNIKSIQEVFHKDATISGLGRALPTPVCPIKILYDMMERNGAFNAQTHVDVLAMTPTTAAVRVELETGEVDCIDFLTLIKIDGKWTIVAKLFHGYY